MSLVKEVHNLMDEVYKVLLDKEELLSWEKHVQYMYENNIWTRSEAREAMGKEPITEEKDLFMYNVSIPLLEAEAKAKAAASPAMPGQSPNESGARGQRAEGARSRRSWACAPPRSGDWGLSSAR